MSKGNGGTRGSGRPSSSGGNYVPNTAEGIQYVKSQLMRFTQVDRWNRNTEYQLGLNDEAQFVVEMVAKGNYGFASQVAQTAVNSPNWNQNGYKLSEKQAYIIASAAVQNKLVSQTDNLGRSTIFNLETYRSAMAKEAAKAAQKARNYENYSATYKRSSTKVAVGSAVTDSKGRKGVISSIITPSSGYVTVKYSDGTTSKQMAFNLYGADGNPLKKRPKN